MVDGERVHRVIGRDSEGVTRTQCEEFIEQARTQAREGRLSLPKGRKTHLGFNEAADRYLTRLKETGGKNLEGKERHLRLFLRPFFGNQRLEGITTFTVDRYKKRRTEEGAAAASVNRELATLSHVFAKAVEWKWLSAKPCQVKKLGESAGRIIALSDEQADALLRGAIADEEPDCWLFVLFGLNTAMRHSEILRVRWEHINFDKMRLYVPQAKAGQREQPITAELAKVLREERGSRSDPDGWVFGSPRPNATLTGHRDRMGKPFRRAVIRADLDPKAIPPHVMRHTAITNLVKAGVDLPTIQRISGHKTLTMVLRYTHVHGQHIDQAIAAIGRDIPERPENLAPSTRPRLRTVGEQAR